MESSASSGAVGISPRTRLAEARRLADFETSDILPNLDRPRLRALHEEFLSRDGVMNRPTFVKVSQ